MLRLFIKSSSQNSHFPHRCPHFLSGAVFVLVCRSYRKSKWSGLSWPQCLLITENHFISGTKIKTKKSRFRGLPLPPQVVGTLYGSLPYNANLLLFRGFRGLGVKNAKWPLRGHPRSNEVKRPIFDWRSLPLSFIHIGPLLPTFSKNLGQLTLFPKIAIFTP